MTVLDPIPTVYDLNTPPLPDKYYMGVKVTDQLDAVSFHYFWLHILPNSPPVPSDPTQPLPPFDNRVHNLTSGEHFAYDFEYDFFWDPDEILTNMNQDHIRTWYMDTLDGTPMPSWISFLPQTWTYLGTAKHIK